MKKYLFFIFGICICTSFSCKQAQTGGEAKGHEIESPKEGFVEHNGASIFYRSLGEGEPIIILHGGPGMDHSYFLPHLDMFSSKYQLIYFDQRAAGKSSFEVDSTNMSMLSMVEDIEAIRRHFKLETINLMGHSWGGLLAMWYAKTYPEKLKRLILLNTIPPNKAYEALAAENLQNNRSAEEVEEMSQLMQSEGFKNRDLDTYLQLFKLNFAASFFDRKYADSLKLSLAENYFERQMKLGLLMPDLQTYDLYEDLRKLKAPSLIIHGDYDATPTAAIEKLAEHIENSKIELIKDAGHFPFIEKKEEFRKILDSFMQD